MRNVTILIASLAAILAATGLYGPQDDFKRERTEANAAQKDALEGKEPPALPKLEWLNTPDGKPLEWKALKGKVVVLDFWAHW